mmetsp:Transcript_15476/g.50891  ORF Transcript_15476/g.50891 Transcript_15476/m.50891 type:complete len:464 (-) Transcript_15476:103-1494(-)
MGVESMSVIGLGKLGAPMVAVFASKGFRVVGVDLNEEFVTQINAGKSPHDEPDLQELLTANKERVSATTDMEAAVHSTDVSFIIVPTPSQPNMFFTNDYVISAVKIIGAALRKKEGYHLVVVTSTVMPGSTGGPIQQALQEASGRFVGENLGLCYNPEFIALGSVVRDMLHPDMLLIGESDPTAGGMLEEIYLRTAQTSPECHRMNFVNAELSKISVNTYVTTKISYANMLADLCDHLPGADADVVTAALGADSRIGKKYLKGAIGYAGPCFPRDNKAFAALGRSLGVDTSLAEATDHINDHQVTRIFNLIEAICNARVMQKLAPGERVCVALLGISYKPDTPVTEMSQTLSLSKMLTDKGYSVELHDPVARPHNVAVQEDMHAAIQKAHIVAVMTSWRHYKGEVDCQFAAEGAQDKVLIDPWRVASHEPLLASDRYYAPGKGALANFFSESREPRTSFSGFY